MIKRYALLAALMVSLIVLAQLIGGIGCQSGKSEFGSPIAAVCEVVYGHVKWLGEQIGYRGGKSESDSLSATAREAVYAQIKWLEEQKFEEPDPPAPLGVNLDDVESNTTRIGRDGGNGNGYGYMDVGVGGGAGVGVGGDGGGGGGGGGG
jgi:hypothetical protein